MIQHSYKNYNGMPRNIFQEKFLLLQKTSKYFSRARNNEIFLPIPTEIYLSRNNYFI